MAHGDQTMTLRQLFFAPASPPPMPLIPLEPVGYPFPPSFVERLKLDLSELRTSSRPLMGVQIGFHSPRLTSFLLAHNVPVFAVEHDELRREAGQRLTSPWPTFHLFAGAPDATGLDDASVDFIVSDRALYWPDQDGVRAEFTRILRPGGVVALVTDNRVYAGGEQAQEFEAILRAHCPNFREKLETLDIGLAVADLFCHGSVFEDAFTGEQRLTLAEFLAQTRAMTVYPAANDPARTLLDTSLRRFFGRWSKKGRLTIPTVCRAAFGRLTR